MQLRTDIVVGPFKYSPAGRLVLSRYVETGNVAILVEDPDSGESLLVASVNIPEIDLAPDEVCIKNWSENEGCEKVLIEAGLIESTGRSVASEFVVATAFKIIGRLRPYLNLLPSHEEFQRNIG